jgi:hypothetical protein
MVMPLKCTGCGAKLSWISSEMEFFHGQPELNGRAYAACLSDGGTYEQLRAFYAGMHPLILTKLLIIVTGKKLVFCAPFRYRVSG